MKRIYVVASFLVLISACGGAVDNDHSAHNANASINVANVGPVDHNAMGHGAAMDHSSMKSSPEAASAPYELQFLDTMMAHHKAAVDMAMLAETRAQYPELKQLAANIIYDQEKEIAKMSEWRDKWFGEKAEAVNMQFPGMAEGMGGMDLQKLQSLKGNDFDLEFIRQMIPHHEGAVTMAKDLSLRDSHAEVKELADDIIAAQTAEIKQMREWLAAWSK